MINYHSDVAFDNQFVDGWLTQLWENTNKSENDDRNPGYQELTPMRRWELSEKFGAFQNPKKCSLKGDEIQSMFVKAISTAIFLTYTLVILSIDFGLGQFLKQIKEKGKFAISFDGNVQINTTWGFQKTYFR